MATPYSPRVSSSQNVGRASQLGEDHSSWMSSSHDPPSFQEVSLSKASSGPAPPPRNQSMLSGNGVGRAIGSRDSPSFHGDSFAAVNSRDQHLHRGGGGDGYAAVSSRDSPSFHGDSFAAVNSRDPYSVGGGDGFASDGYRSNGSYTNDGFAPLQSIHPQQDSSSRPYHYGNATGYPNPSSSANGKYSSSQSPGPGNARGYRSSANGQYSSSQSPGPGNARGYPNQPGYLSSSANHPGNFRPSIPSLQVQGHHSLPDPRGGLSAGANRPLQSLAPQKFQHIELLEDSLGAGSYGQVFKARCDGVLICAAKVIHPVLLTRTPAPQSPENRFMEECKGLSSLRHPNIVQYLGTHEEKTTLMLLMELMDQNLTQFLNKPIPFHTQVNICHDVSLALSFLHSKGIIHRDLSSNNVLMIGDRRAKVTDFGMARWQNRDASLTACPGTTVYMAPEALDNQSHYNKSLDCFSLGVLAVQVLVRIFPNPGKRHRQMQTAEHPDGIEVVVPEVERRQNHIQLVDPPGHPILQVARECLDNKANKRPSAEELSCRFETLKKQDAYRQSNEGRSGDTHHENEGHLGEGNHSNAEASIVQSLLENVCAQSEEINSLKVSLRTELGSSHDLQRTLSAQQEEMDLAKKKYEEQEQLMMSKDQEINSLRSQNERQWAEMIEAPKRGEVEALRREMEEKNELLQILDIKHMNVLMELEEVKGQLKREKELQEANQAGAQMQSSNVFESQSPNLARVTKSLPLQMAYPPNPRQRSWSTSSSANYSPQTGAVQQPTSMTLDLLDMAGQRSAGEGVLSVEAELRSLANADYTVIAKVNLSYHVSYIPKTRGRHVLNVSINGEKISSYPVFVEYPIEKIQSVCRTIGNLPEGINCIATHAGRLYLSVPKSYLILNSCSGDVLHTTICNRRIDGIAVDSSGNVYFTSQHALHQFNGNGHMLGVVGSYQSGKHDQAFSSPRGLAIHKDHLHVCDSKNSRIMKFDLKLGLVKKYGEGINKTMLHRTQNSRLQEPVDITFSESGRAYILDIFKKAIVIFLNEVYDSIIWVGDSMVTPIALCMRGKYVLVSDLTGYCIGIYCKVKGFVRKIAVDGSPFGICSDVDGFVYVANTNDSVLMVL